MVGFWPSTIVYPVPVRPLTNPLKLPDPTELAGLWIWDINPFICDFGIEGFMCIFILETAVDYVSGFKISCPFCWIFFIEFSSNKSYFLSKWKSTFFKDLFPWFIIFISSYLLKFEIDVMLRSFWAKIFDTCPWLKVSEWILPVVCLLVKKFCNGPVFSLYFYFSLSSLILLVLK